MQAGKIDLERHVLVAAQSAAGRQHCLYNNANHIKWKHAKIKASHNISSSHSNATIPVVTHFSLLISSSGERL